MLYTTVEGFKNAMVQADAKRGSKKQMEQFLEPIQNTLLRAIEQGHNRVSLTFDEEVPAEYLRFLVDAGWSFQFDPDEFAFVKRSKTLYRYVFTRKDVF